MGIEEANEGGISATYGYEFTKIDKSTFTQKMKFGFANNLRLDENINIPALKRGEDVIMAHGDTEIYDEDHLIVFYKNKDVIDNFYNAFR